MSHIKRTDKFCLSCGKKLGWSAKYQPQRNIKYCRLCFSKSLEFKEKVLKTTFKKGFIPWNKGLNGFMAGEKNSCWKGGKPKCSDCGKILVSYKAKRCPICSYKYMVGDKHPNWKGGLGTIRHKIMQTFEYKNWRTKVFQSDNYTCRICGEIGGRLNADHIKPWSLFPKLRFKLSNGQTLCEECHKLKNKEEMKNNWSNQYSSSGVYKVAQVI